jgi:hypothetical protein
VVAALHARAMRYSWRQSDLPELVATFAARPGHETVCTLIADILRNGFGAAQRVFTPHTY